ncbi:hypothetical protein Syun_031829 [Stephania yunnanensis]|uniref:Retrovirus-related Pol polyprotein from transposon TNT 1-94-like beta-barrel domain-containing protein n=1 Tax=Stephania yunnanensis TaxID=152371 RepID=A0AAP0HF87_9MAGN
MANIERTKKLLVDNQFTSIDCGFKAQQLRHFNKEKSNNSFIDTKQRRPTPLEGRRMTLAERDLYREEHYQYGGTKGRIAKTCWWIPKKPTQLSGILTTLAALTLDNSVVDTEWTFGTGASNHMTGNQGMLTNLRKYDGSDSIFIRDGSFMPITSIGDTYLNQKCTSLPLHNVLLVPNLSKKLLSISQLTTQFPVNCEFSNSDFFVKERTTGQPIITWKRKGDLHVLSNSPELHFPLASNQVQRKFGINV